MIFVIQLGKYDYFVLHGIPEEKLSKFKQGYP